MPNIEILLASCESDTFDSGCQYGIEFRAVLDFCAVSVC